MKTAIKITGIVLTAGILFLTNQALAILTTVTAIPIPATQNTNSPSSSSNGVVPPPIGTNYLTNAWVDLSFWTGARFNSPYTINGTTHALTATGNSSDPYLEINLNSRYVLRHGPQADPSEAASTGKIQWVNPLPFPIHWKKDCNQTGGWDGNLPDITASLGYIFNESTVSNYNASTIVGSSDFYLNTSVGFPFLRYCSDTNGTWKQQLSVEISDGFTTDKNFMELHNTFFGGLGWQGGFILDGKQGYWFGRAGYALIDQPKLVGGTSTVEFNNLNQPEFDQKWVPSLGATVVFPLTQTLSLNAGVNAYFSSNPANWNANIGVSIDLSKLATALKSALSL